MSYIPHGRDQQGRLKTGVHIPEPAAASTDGACGDDIEDKPGRHTTEAERDVHRLIGFVVVLILLVGLSGLIAKADTPRTVLSCPLT